MFELGSEQSQYVMILYTWINLNWIELKTHILDVLVYNHGLKCYIAAWQYFRYFDFNKIYQKYGIRSVLSAEWCKNYIVHDVIGYVSIDRCWETSSNETIKYLLYVWRSF